MTWSNLRVCTRSIRNLSNTLSAFFKTSVTCSKNNFIKIHMLYNYKFKIALKMEIEFSFRPRFVSNTDI